jgi:phage tail-like protein
VVHDPYDNFKFRVSWDGKHIVGVSSVSPLRRTTEVLEHREGGEPSEEHKLPGLTKYDSITLKRGITSDTAFEDWANSVWKLGSTPEGVLNFRKDVVIDVLDRTGTRVLSYKVLRCWVSEYQALPQLDADENWAAIEQIKLENEGWERDITVHPPAGE